MFSITNLFIKKTLIAFYQEENIFYTQKITIKNNKIIQKEEQSFEDEDEMQRFEDKYANYVKTVQDIGHLNITDTTKDEMREAFFKVDRPAYKQDQKAKAHNAVIDEAKQRGVDTGVFENIGDVNKWIGRLKKKQAGKYVAYGDEAKENYLTENKLDTMMYNQFDGWDQ
jgi:hypothetical protein